MNDLDKATEIRNLSKWLQTKHNTTLAELDAIMREHFKTNLKDYISEVVEANVLPTINCIITEGIEEKLYDRSH